MTFVETNNACVQYVPLSDCFTSESFIDQFPESKVLLKRKALPLKSRCTWGSVDVVLWRQTVSFPFFQCTILKPCWGSAMQGRTTDFPASACTCSLQFRRSSAVETDHFKHSKTQIKKLVQSLFVSIYLYCISVFGWLVFLSFSRHYPNLCFHFVGFCLVCCKHKLAKGLQIETSLWLYFDIFTCDVQ